MFSPLETVNCAGPISTHRNAKATAVLVALLILAVAAWWQLGWGTMPPDSRGDGAGAVDQQPHEELRG